MDALSWYGLTREEAESRCEELKLIRRFAVTEDPKAADRGGGGPAARREKTEAVPKVIRVREENGGLFFLLGLFAPEKGSVDNDGE